MPIHPLEFAPDVPEGYEGGEIEYRMGIEFLELSAARSVASMPVHGNRQRVGLLHGGAFVVLGESLGSMSASLHAGSDRHVVGIEVNASHSGAATGGRVTATCIAIHLGRTLCTHEVTIVDEAGRLCSTVRITNLLRPGRD